MPSQRAGRCFQGERGGGGVEDVYRRGLCLCGCIEILQEAEGRKRRKSWLFLLPMATVVAHHQEQSGRQIEPIGRNDTHQGVTLRSFHFLLLLNWDYLQLSAP